MSKLIGSLNNREIATVLWLTICLIWCLSRPEIRSSLFDVIRAFFAKAIIIPVMLMVVYVLLVVFCLSHFGVWDETQVKATALWIVTVALAMMFRIGSKKDPALIFKGIVIDSIGITLLLEFLFNFFSFPLIIEVLSLPILVTVFAMQVIAEREEQYKAVNKLLGSVIAIYGFIVVIFTIYSIFVDFNRFSSLQTVRDFVVPPILSICFFPYLYCLLMYATYEMLFLRMRYFIRDPDTYAFARRRLLFYFHVRLSALEQWAKLMPRRSFKNRQDVIDSLREA